mmetsp:Transcript_20305/g.28551  ORF Transcript_20305/g.28551 Transcript_20305/m.28551 type:complete len:83 (-) Transcript_20305:690-938(-)
MNSELQTPSTLTQSRSLRAAVVQRSDEGKGFTWKLSERRRVIDPDASTPLTHHHQAGAASCANSCCSRLKFRAKFPRSAMRP